MTVKAKLAWAFGVLVVILVAVVVIATLALNRAQGEYERYARETSQRMALANDIMIQTGARAIAARNLVLVTTEADKDLEKAAVTASHTKVTEGLARLRAALDKQARVDPRERQLLGDIAAVEEKYGPVALNIVRLALEGNRDASIDSMNKDCRPLLAALESAGTSYLTYLSEQAEKEVAAAEKAAHVDVLIMTIAGALASLLGLVLAFGIVRGLGKALGAEPVVLGEVAQRVASGDLSPVTGAGHAASGSVMASLVAMQQSLSSIVGQVRQASDSIATGSAQIATGNADLSQRTELQASNLQETAASMEEMTATVKNNADTAGQASQLASSASSAAERGGVVVRQVVETMDGITASSRRIGDIIGVIDGIAFQTNILALNAAVEAARAGEQGRGFAVVAGEVRNLAQRSAEAARQIKDLIADSTEKVSAGSQLVGLAGTTMDDIVNQVRRVNDLIGEIGSATSEQTNGISQVSSAVSQLDQATQQNAALVEESAAAAESLRSQAQRLTEVVAIFRGTV